MKGSIRSLISPYLIILLLLSFIIPTLVMPIGEVQALVSDNITITSPTTAAPLYAKAGGSVNITSLITCNAASAVDIDIYVYQPGTTTVVNHNYYGPDLAIGVNTCIYAADIPTGTAAGYYDVCVRARQPQLAGDYTWSAIQTNAIHVDNTLPSTPTLLTPTTGTYTNDNTPTLSWNPVTKAGHTILYDLQVDNTSSSSFITATMPVNVTGVATCNYTTTAIPDGIKYWHVRATDNATNQSAWSTVWSFFIDTVAPTAVPTPTAPANGSTLGGCYNPLLTWADNVTDAAPSSGLRYWVQVSSEPTFATYSAISENITLLTNTSYTPGASLTAGTWYWRVCARDQAWNTTGWSTAQSFTKPSCVNAYTVTMGTGWNLISLPLCPSGSTTNPPSITPTQFLAACDNASAVAGIFGYYPEATTWKYYVVGNPSNTLDGSSYSNNIQVTKGYWIQTTSPVILTINGTSCPSAPYNAITGILYPGWNLIGFKSTSSIAANTYLGATAAANISYICRYPAGWDCGTPATVTFQPGQGSWVFNGSASNISYGLPCN